MAITNFHNLDGSPSPLSNFYQLRLTAEDGIDYPSVEHAYQAAKTNDTALRLEIARLASPGRAKRAGRQLQLRPDWEAVKLGMMRDLLRRKFDARTDPVMVRYLLRTGDSELIDGNPWGDRYWGVYQGQGENWLGFLLMGVRAELRARQLTGDPLAPHSARTVCACGDPREHGPHE